MIITYNSTTITFRDIINDKSWPNYKKTSTKDLSGNINTNVKEKTIFRKFRTEYITKSFWENEVLDFIDWVARGGVITIGSTDYKLSTTVTNFEPADRGGIYGFGWEWIEQ